MKTFVTIAAILYCGMSLALFVTMGLDKRFAKTGHRRVPEKSLFLLAALCGAAGGLMGMYAFRHKTKHWYFQFGIPAIMIVQIAAVYWLSQKGVITLPFAP